MSPRNVKEAILLEARQAAQAHGYNGLNFRDLAQAVGIKAPTIYHYFPNKADLGEAVARRYWQDIAEELNAMAAESTDPRDALRKYPRIFRRSLVNGNRLCLGSFMAAEYDDLPEAVKKEVQAFADVNVAWLSQILAAVGVKSSASEKQARAMFAAIAGAQLLARSRADLALFDQIIESYQSAGLLAGSNTHHQSGSAATGSD